MRRLTRIIVAGVLTAIVLGGATGAFAATGYKYTVTLKPVNVKNSKGTPVALATGTATVTLYPVRRQLCYSITVHGIKLPATAAHITTSSGTTVATLTAPGKTGRSVGCTHHALSRTIINTIHGSPTHYLLTVNSTNPSVVLHGTL